MNTKEPVLIAAATFLIIIGAYIAVPIGPVPIVLTNFFVILVGLILGWKKATIAVLTYIILGALGLPLFSNGRGGLGVLLGLTGGFIIGFIPLAFISGLVQKRSVLVKFIAIITGSVILYSIGIPWAIHVYNTTIAPSNGKELWRIGTALKYTAIPFLIPDLIKIIAAISISKLVAPTIKPFIESRDE
ncbi:MAG: hypothetical protein B6229_02655 [Spirochaetaceae bacterium 4572_7]|nr:MAG: hypothetical protein B6229_02655 [Spirochaetaceae bacterium 4572_7]